MESGLRRRRTTATGRNQTRERGELFGPRFELFADVLSLGVATTVACLPVITAPAALSAGCATLRERTDRAGTAGAKAYGRRLLNRVRSGRLRGDLLAGLIQTALITTLVIDLALANAGLPGGAAVVVVLLMSSAALLVVGLRAAARPESEVSWREAVIVAARASVADPTGSVLLLMAVATAVLCAFVSPPLALLVAGPLALAATAVDLRSSVGNR